MQGDWAVTDAPLLVDLGVHLRRGEKGGWRQRVRKSVEFNRVGYGRMRFASVGGASTWALEGRNEEP